MLRKRDEKQDVKQMGIECGEMSNWKALKFVPIPTTPLAFNCDGVRKYDKLTIISPESSNYFIHLRLASETKNENDLYFSLGINCRNLSDRGVGKSGGELQARHYCHASLSSEISTTQEPNYRFSESC